MSIHRILWPRLSTSVDEGHLVEVTGPEAHHAVTVKRLGPGDEAVVLNGRGVSATTVIETVAKRTLVLRVRSIRQDPPPLALVIASPVPKGARAEMMIDQLSQVGVRRWIPLVTARSVVDPRLSRLEKWRQSTVVESAKQCGRAWLMEIADPTPWDEAIRGAAGRLFLADARGAVDWSIDGDAATVLIGPEGGLTIAEHETAIAAGARPVSLAPHILRLETAALAAAALAGARLLA